MNKFMRNRKIVIAILMACVLILSLVITAFAETAGGGTEKKDYWSDPLFFQFIFWVVAFVCTVICTIFIAIAVKRRNKEKEYEDREGHIKLYEDLEDMKWDDAPDSVFLDDLEPAAAILSDMQPAKPIRGLESFDITEEPISPAQALNMGADPFTQKNNNVENLVFEEGENKSPITPADMDIRPEEPAPALSREPSYFAQPTYSPFVEPNKQPTEHPFVYQNVRYSVLEDGSLASEPVQPIAYAASETSPLTYFTPEKQQPFYQDVPITIYTSADDDGVVQLNATIYENKDGESKLKDDSFVADINKVDPIVAADTPASEPVSGVISAEDSPLAIPVPESNIFEDTVSASALEDEIIPTVAEPVIIPDVATPKSAPVTDSFVRAEEPVVIPATEANIIEDTVSVSALEDEIIPTVAEPVIIPDVATPKSAPVTDSFVRAEEPVIVPVTEANIIEDTVSASALEDEIIPTVAEPVIIPDVATPKSAPVTDSFVRAEEPVVIPATEANIIEDTVSVSALEDEIIPTVAEPVIIPDVATPKSAPVAGSFVRAEEPVVIPATEANIIEDTVSASALEDEIIPTVAEPVIIPDVATPKSAPVTDSFVRAEEPVIVPVTEANIIEDTVSVSALEDEIIPAVAEPVIIPDVATPKSAPVTDSFVRAEEPVVIPATEANIFEDTISTTALEDEVVIQTPEAIIIPDVATPKSAPVTDSFVRAEEPVIVPVTEANIIEDTVSATALEDEVIISTPETVHIPEATTPLSSPLADNYVEIEEPIFIPISEVNIYEDIISASAIEDEFIIPVDEAVFIPDVATPKSAPIGDSFVRAEEPVVIPATEANIFEDSVSTIALEDEVVISTPEAIIIPDVATPKSAPVTDSFVRDEEPVVIPVTEANIFEDSVSTIALEDEVVISTPEAIIIPDVATPKSAPIGDSFVRAEEPVVIPVTEANIFEDSVSATLLEDEVVISTPEAIIIPDVATPKSAPIGDSFVRAEEPVIIPVTEANIFEDSVSTTALEDEVVIQTPEAVIIPDVATPKSAPVTDSFVRDEEPVIIPVTEANIFEDSVSTIALEDEVVISTPEAIIIPDVATPKSAPIGDSFVRDEEPVVIPVTEANIFEDTVSATALEDEVVIQTPEAVIIPDVATPKSAPVTDSFVRDEEPVVIPVTEANIFEDSVSATALEDEVVISTPEAIIIPDVATPKSAPIGDSFVRAEEPVVIPVTEANIFEDSISTIALEDEVVISAPEAIIIPDVATLKSAPIGDSFVRAEEPVIIPVTEANIFEDSVSTTALEDEVVISAPEAIIIPDVATPKSAPIGDSFVRDEEPVVIPVTEANIFEDTVSTTLLEDNITISDPTAVVIPLVAESAETSDTISEAVTPKFAPIAGAFIRAEEPVVIPVTEANIFEDTVSTTSLEDEVVISTPEAIIIPDVATPKSAPIGDSFVRDEEPVVIPVTEANIFEDTVSATALEDEVVIQTPEAVIIPDVATPKSAPVTDSFVRDEEPVVIPVTEANIFEDSVSATALEDEVVIQTPEAIIIPDVATPKSAPVGDSFVRAEEPVVIPATEANIFEDTVSTTALEDEVVISTPEAIIIPDVATPKSAPIGDSFVRDEEPVVIPATEANIFEDTISTTALEDEVVIQTPEAIIIPDVATPKSAPIGDSFVRAEEPVVIPVTEANIFEDTVSTTSLEDEVVISTPEAIIIPDVATPKSAPIGDSFVRAEEPVVIPATEANIFEDTVSASALEDEVVIQTPEAIIIPDVATPKSAPVTDSFVRDEEPVVIPATEANIFEDTISTTALEDEVVIQTPEAIIIPDVATPKSAPIGDSFVRDEEPVVIPATEANIFEDSVSATLLEDNITISDPTAVVIPLVVESAEDSDTISEAVTPKFAPIFGAFVGDEEPVVIPATEANIFEDSVSATALEDEVVISTPEAIIIPDVATPKSAPIGDSFVRAEEPVVIPATEANIFEDTISTTALEDEVVISAPEAIIIPDVATPKSAPIGDSFVRAEEPVVIPVTEANIFEDTVSTTSLEDEVVISTPEAIIIPDVATPKSAPIGDSFVRAEEPVIIPVTEANIFEDTVSATALEDEVVISAPEAIIISDVATPNSAPVTDSFVRAEEPETISATEANIFEENVPTTVLKDEILINDQNEILISDGDDQNVESIKVSENVGEQPTEKISTIPTTKQAEESTKKISTIPTTANGKVKHQDPMIPTLPPIQAKGIGSNALEAPFVLPVNDAFKKENNGDENGTSFENAVRDAADIPVAPVIDISGNEAPAKKPAPAPAAPTLTQPEPTVIMADADVEITYDGDKEEPLPEKEPIPEPEEESVPEEEPILEEEPISEPVEEPTPEEEPIPEPVFVDAVEADELMTDEEAEEHIETIEEEPGRERKGKFNAINLDTLCDNYDDGETVTLESLKDKKLIPSNTGRVKILARGRMSKKLDIVADNFSLQAVKMITLAGGRAEQYK